MLIHSCNLLYDAICVLHSLHLGFVFIFLSLCRLAGTISNFFFLLIWILLLIHMISYCLMYHGREGRRIQVD